MRSRPDSIGQFHRTRAFPSWDLQRKGGKAASSKLWPANSIHADGPGAEDAGSLAHRAHPPVCLTTSNVRLQRPPCGPGRSRHQPLMFADATRASRPAWGRLGIRPSSLEQAATTDAVHRIACLEARASRVMTSRNVVSSLARRHKGSRRKPVGASSLTMAARGCAHDGASSCLPRVSACPRTPSA